MQERAFQSLELHKVLARLANFAVSEAGREACLALRPAPDLQELRQRADFFQQTRLWLERSTFSLTSFPALEGVLRFLESPLALLDLDALWALRQILAQAKAAMESLSGESGQKPQEEWPLLLARAASFPAPTQSMAALLRCLSDDGHLRDEASPELSLARGEIRRLHQMCTRKVKDFVQSHNLEQYLQDSYMTLSSDRYVLPLKSNFKGRIQGIIHDYSQTGETCYFEPMFLVEVNNRLQELRREEREAELKVLRFLTDLIISELGGVRGAYALLVELDRLQACAVLAACYDGCMVEFGDDRPVEIHAARHPLLALTHAASPATAPAPVPVDLILKQHQKALVISGGNAGGKTVALKTLGLTALMGMCGLPVPASRGGSLPFWHQVQVFIGDEQSLEDHVSTFTAQIQHLTKAWSAATHGTLVILDEFGAGTDPAQGAALAQAVVDSLMERGAHVAAATHFPAMKAYALSNEQVRAASVLFDPDSKKPLFRLAYDQVGASQALDVAREHGLPEEVLRRAGQYLLLDGADTAALVDRLNTLAVAREGELDALAAERSALAEKRRRLEERFAADREKLFAQIQKEAQSVLKDWKASRISHKQALKELAKTRKILLDPSGDATGAEKTSSERLDVAALRPGMTVLHLPWNKQGTVVEVDERRGRVRLDLSGVTLWTEAADLAPASVSGKSSGNSASGIRVHSTSVASLRLDLRGMRADVAIAEVERFLDASLLGGREEVEILHGRGTGALRREVHDFLKRCSLVGSFSLAPEDQGGDGVTIVVLR